jgi:RsiW-degrading membrane proteinase PrsW (M82 family)
MAFLRCTNQYGLRKDFPLTAKHMTVGRDLNNLIVIDDPSVSNNHAVVNLINGAWLLSDIGSTNGIFFEGSRVDKVQLKSGTEFTIGNVICSFIQEKKLEQNDNTKPIKTVQKAHSAVTSFTLTVLSYINSSRLGPLVVCMLVFGCLMGTMVPDAVFHKHQIIPIILLFLASMPLSIKAGLYAMNVEALNLKRALICFVFTMLLGIALLLSFYWFLEDFKFQGGANKNLIGLQLILKIFQWAVVIKNDPSANVLEQFLGMAIGVGLLEELTKSLPAIWLVFVSEKKISTKDLLTVGFFSGLGFGVGEALYTYAPWSGSNMTGELLIRWFQCVPGHAVYAACDAVFLSFLAPKIKNHCLNNGFLLFGNICLAMVTISVVHALYNLLCGFSIIVTIALEVASLGLLYFSVMYAEGIKMGNLLSNAATTAKEVRNATWINTFFGQNGSFKSLYKWSFVLALSAITIFAQEEPLHYSSSDYSETETETEPHFDNGFHEGQSVSWVTQHGNYLYYVSGIIEDPSGNEGMLQVKISKVKSQFRDQGIRPPGVSQVNQFIEPVSPFFIGQSVLVSLSQLSRSGY